MVPTIFKRKRLVLKKKNWPCSKKMRYTTYRYSIKSHNISLLHNPIFWRFRLLHAKFSLRAAQNSRLFLTWFLMFFLQIFFPFFQYMTNSIRVSWVLSFFFFFIYLARLACAKFKKKKKSVTEWNSCNEKRDGGKRCDFHFRRIERTKHTVIWPIYFKRAKQILFYRWILFDDKSRFFEENNRDLRSGWGEYLKKTFLEKKQISAHFFRRKFTVKK